MKYTERFIFCFFLFVDAVLELHSVTAPFEAGSSNGAMAESLTSLCLVLSMSFAYELYLLVRSLRISLRADFGTKGIYYYLLPP